MDSEMEVFAVKTEFIQKYYEALGNAPETLLTFYSECSQLTWLGFHDQTALPLTTLQTIEKEIRSTSLGISSVFIEASLAQLSSQGGILLTVVGGFTKFSHQQRFFQTFSLVQSEETESGYCIQDDILRILPPDGMNEWTSSTIHDGNNKPPYTSKFVPKVDSTSHIHDGNTKQTSTSKFIPSVIKNQKASSSYMHDGSTLKASTSIPTPSEEASTSKFIPSVIKNQKASSSYMHDGSTLKASTSIPTPSEEASTSKFIPSVIKNQKASSSYMHDGSTSEGSTSMPTPSGEVRGARRKIHVASTDGNKASASRTIPTPRGDADERSIYISKMPIEVTKGDIRFVMEHQFGDVKRGTNSVRIYQWCSATVEFKSSESARLAVQAGHVTIHARQANIKYGRST